MVAEDDGRIVGLLVLQNVLHVEPLWVDEAYRGRHVSGRLVSGMKKLFSNTPMVFAHTENPRVGKLLARFGMEPLEKWRTFRWRPK